eukprot:g4103.t1
MIRVFSWNILADSYARCDSYPYALKEHLKWQHRWPQIAEALSGLAEDAQRDGVGSIFVLQEVDKPDESGRLFRSLNLDVHFCKRTGSRKDGCLTAWNPGFLECIEVQEIDFDSLSVSFGAQMIRHNVSLLIALRWKATGQIIIVGNSHLYWSPHAAEVKLLQARSLQIAIQRFASKHHAAAILCCGDFNSVPGSDVYRFMTEGKLPPPGPLPSCFFADDNLYQLTRWMRAVGLDVEVVATQRMLRESSYLSEIFKRCTEENRGLLTMSRKLMQRRGGRTGSIFQVKSQANLEDEFKRIVSHFQLQLNPDKFYMRCVKCNFIIQAAQRDVIPKDAIGPDRNVPLAVYDSDEQLFMCCGCKQVYWWGDAASAHRALSLVNKLQQLSNEAASATLEPSNIGRNHDDDDDDESRPKLTNLLPAASWNWQLDELASGMLLLLRHAEDDVPKDNVSRVSAPIPATYSGSDSTDDQKASCFRSAYFSMEKEKSKSRATFKTNHTETFSDVIDYIFYRGALSLASLSYSPKSAGSKMHEYLPSPEWPSDHLMISAEFDFGNSFC